MARRTRYVPLVCLLLCLGVFCTLPRVHGAVFTDTTEIRHEQVVFYLVALQNGDNFSINCSTYFNSSIKAYLLTQRPVEDAVNPTHINSSDTDDFQNLTTLAITTNETKIFYIEIIQQDDKTDFLLVNATHQLTRYYIPFIGGYPIIEMFLAITLGVVLVRTIRKSRKKRLVVM